MNLYNGISLLQIIIGNLLLYIIPLFIPFKSHDLKRLYLRSLLKLLISVLNA